MKSFKKVLIVAITGLCLMSSFANAANTGHDNKFHGAKNSSQMLKKVSDYPFDVFVKNRSNYIVNIDVPEAGYHDTLFPGDDYEVYSYSYHSGIEIILSRTDGSVFFDQYVQNHQTVWVDNGLSASGKLKATLHK